MPDIIKEYKKDALTIVWKPDACIHSTICWKAATGLPSVFNPFEKPWIRLEEVSMEEVVEQIKKCPSGALSYYIGEKIH
jgi:uncharacterized Fe-S cluster protein YjdI